MDLTVAICTYQRFDLLQRALQSLCVCTPPVGSWELIVVDNAGDAKVQQMVESFADRLPVRYLVEQKLGHSNARNCAMAAARAPVVLFTDDDVTFDPGWLRTMARAIAEHPECNFVGGRIQATWEQVDPPDWYDPQRCPMYHDMLVQYDEGPHSGYWDGSRHRPFFGASLAVRVDAVKRVGGFDPTMGHKGHLLIGGDDSLMIDALSRNGGKGWYVAEALLYHPVPPQRMTRQYARAFAWRQGKVSVATQLRQGDAAPQQARLPRWWYRVALEQMLLGLGRWVSGLLRGDGASAFAGRFHLLFNASKFWHALRSS